MSPSCLSIAGKFSRKAVDREEYSELVSRSLPHVIQNEAENEHYTRLLEALDSKPHPTAAEQELAALLTILIENFEEAHYSLRKATPIESLIELMHVNNLKQKDMVDVFRNT